MSWNNFLAKMQDFRQKVSLVLQGWNEDKVDEEIFCSFPKFTALSVKQIMAILKVVREEVGITHKLGHSISRETIFKEKTFFLTFFQNMGGVSALTKRFSFVTARYLITDTLSRVFFEETRDAFAESDGKGSRNWYQIHLELLACKLLNLIWSNQLTKQL